MRIRSSMPFLLSSQSIGGQPVLDGILSQKENKFVRNQAQDTIVEISPMKYADMVKARMVVEILYSWSLKYAAGNMGCKVRKTGHRSS